MTTQKRLNGIQALRAIAALLVVLDHSAIQLNRYGANGPYWELGFGAAGVDIFFVISGVIMVYISAPLSGDGGVVSIWRALGFWKQRAYRIVPIYWVWTSAFVLVLLISPSLAKTAVLDLEHVVKSYLFVPTFHPNPEMRDNIWPLLVPGWSLNYEMYFYLLFGLVLVLPTRSLRQPILIATLASLTIFGMASRPVTAAGIVYTDSILLEFIFGIMIGMIYLRGRWLSSGAAMMLVLAGAMLLVASEAPALDQLPRVVKWGVPGLLLVVGVLGMEERFTQSGVLSRLGDASYSIYLSHTLTLAALGVIYGRSGMRATLAAEWAILMAGVALSVLIGLASYHLIEQPVGQALRGK